MSHVEHPILVEYQQVQDFYSYIGVDTAVERRPVRPEEVWFEYDNVPANPPDQSPFPGTPDGGNVVSGISGVVLTQVPGNANRFQSLLGQFLNMVPAIAKGDAYIPTLRDDNGEVVPYDPSVWIADGLLRVIEFKYGIPEGVVPPFTIDYWRYIGPFLTSGGVANEGGGAGEIFDTVVAGVSQLRTLDFDPAAGSEGISVTTSGQKVLIGNTLTGVNRTVVGGARVFAVKNGATLEFRQLLAGNNIGIVENADDITITSGFAPSVTSFSNDGGGAGQVYDTVIGMVVHLRTIDLDPTAGREGIIVGMTGSLITIGNTMTGGNIGAGAQLFSAKTAGAVLQFRSLIAAASTGLTLTQNANDITISATAGTVVTALANEGAGTGLIFDAIVGNTANLRSLIASVAAGSEGISIATGATTVTIGNTLTAANLGAGSQLFASKTAGAVLQFRSLIAAASTGLTLTQNANDITISATAGAVVTALANEGAGTGLIFDAIVGNTANLRTLIASVAVGSEGISIATGATTVTIGNTLTATNLGAGSQLFTSKTAGAVLQFRSLIAAASSGLTFTQNANDITVSATTGAVVTALANEGAGTGSIFDAIVGNTANLRTLIASATAGSEGISIATGATTVTIGNTLTAANIGAGAQIFSAKTTGAVLQLRSLIAAASSGLTLTQNANDITVSATTGAVVTALANEGAGTGSIFDAIVGNTANLRTLIADVTAGNEGIVITTGATTVTIGNTLTATNLGAGAQIFTTKTAGALLQLRSLIAGTGITVTQNANDISAAITNTAVTAGSYRLTNLTVNAQGQLTAAATGGFGNVVFVDAVNGNNGLGARNGYPFLTITAALAAAVAGDVVYIFPGTYSEAITIPASISVRGLSAGGVTIQQLAVVGATDLVTMGTGSRLEDVTLAITTASNVNIQAIVFPSTTTASARVRSVIATVTNTAGAGAANTIGIRSSGTGAPATTFNAIARSTITVTGSGTNVTRGILLDSAATMNVKDLEVSATGGATAYGVETNNASAGIVIRTSSLSGATADISQTLGSISLAATSLATSNANSLGFIALTGNYQVCYANSGSVATGTRYHAPGTNATIATEIIQARVERACVARAITARANTAPGVGNSATWTLRKNTANTALTVTLTGAATAVTSAGTTSATFAAGDTYDLQISSTGSMANLQVVLYFY